MMAIIFLRQKQYPDILTQMFENWSLGKFKNHLFIWLSLLVKKNTLAIASNSANEPHAYTKLESESEYHYHYDGDNVSVPKTIPRCFNPGV